MSEEITNTVENNNSKEIKNDLGLVLYLKVFISSFISSCLKALKPAILIAIFVILPICLCPILFSMLKDSSDVISSMQVNPATFNYTGEYYTYHEAIHKHIAQVASMLQSGNLMCGIGLVCLGVLALVLNAFTNLLVIIMGIGIGNKVENILKDKVS